MFLISIKLLFFSKISNRIYSVGVSATPKAKRGNNTEIYAELFAISEAIA